MDSVDFPTWFGVGGYGGLLCALAAAAGIAGYAVLTHRAASLQLARAILACLVAACLILPSLWWSLNRLDLYGPALGEGEVVFWLTWTVVFGWGVPLGVLAYYTVLAVPRMPVIAGPQRRGTDAFAALDDPARANEPFGKGRAWASLVPLEGAFAGNPIALTQELTILGRELDSDIVLDDAGTSRHHAEIHWQHGRPQLTDRNSLNGTLINRQPVRGPTPLKSGDIIELGASRYQFELLAGGTPSRPRLAGPDVDETRKLPGAAGAQDEVRAPALAVVALGGPLAGVRWELTNAVVTIGRDRECVICLPDESVSRRHAQIVRQRSGYFITDVESSNGTYVNGEPVEAPRRLAPGDVLRFGAIELRCDASRKVAEAVDEQVRHGEPTRALWGSQPRASLESAQRATPPAAVRLGPIPLTPPEPPAADTP